MTITKQRLKKFSLVFALLFITIYGKGQVTIGDVTAPRPGTVLDLKKNSTTGLVGGLLLPNVDISDVELIPGDFSNTDVRNKDTAQELAGTVVYNTNPATGVGVFIWNGDKWHRLNSSNSLTTDNCQTSPVKKEGGNISCTVTDIDCKISGEYKFEVIAGSDFISVDVLDAGQGKFKVNFNPSNQAITRSAIIMAISPCGNSNMFVYTQEGDATACGATVVPQIKSQNPNNSLELCSGGAVYLYLDGRPTDGNFIWTLNGKTVGTGNSYLANQAGRYIVYGDKIGCGGQQEALVTMSNNTAPAPVRYIVVGNNGQACGEGGKVPLIVSKPSVGTIAWYKDGVKTNLTGNEINAEKGYWEAVVEDGNCSSIPTSGVNVFESTETTPLARPSMKINGMTNGAWTFCKGGSLFLEVESPAEGITYTWYADNTEIGKGSGIYYAVPTSAEQLVIRLRATGTGCAQEVLSSKDITISSIPAAPFISVDTQNSLCGGRATLTASSPAGTASYRWFKDGTIIANANTKTLEVLQTGSYTVCAVSSGGCASLQSAPRTIAASDFGNISWVSHPETVNVGLIGTYSVQLDFPQGAKYNWSVTNGTITNGQGTSIVSVLFNTVGASSVTCEASNNCGTIAPLTQSVTVASNCSNAEIKNTSPLNTSIKIGTSTTLSVTATGNPALAYQWYKGALGQGEELSDGKTNTYQVNGNAEGKTSYYCVVSVGGDCSSATTGQFNVSVTKNPETIATSAVGAGSFAGKTCFDIAFSNGGSNGCGTLASRKKTDFELTVVGAESPYSGAQAYTFTPTSAVSNVRFDYIDPSGIVVESITPEQDYSGTGILGACTAIIKYQPSLNENLKGITRTNALKADLYVIYNDNPNGGGTDRSIKLTATFSDCGCCGAYTSTHTWVNFMCHNLGADQSLDPSDPSSDGAKAGGLAGSYYQWGQKTPLTISNFKVIGNYSGTFPGKKAWSSTEKAANDPCPPGYVVPSQKLLLDVFKSNALTFLGPWTNLVTTRYASVLQLGSSLFLPTAGRSAASPTGGISGTGTDAAYWTSDYNGLIGGTPSYYSSYLIMASGKDDKYFFNSDNIYTGRPVRCVEQQ